MKINLILFSMVLAAACSQEQSVKHTESSENKTTPCKDSTEVEMFDENGNAYFVKMPCDSVPE